MYLSLKLHNKISNNAFLNTDTDIFTKLTDLIAPSSATYYSTLDT